MGDDESPKPGDGIYYCGPCRRGFPTREERDEHRAEEHPAVEETSPTPTPAPIGPAVIAGACIVALLVAMIWWDGRNTDPPRTEDARTTRTTSEQPTTTRPAERPTTTLDVARLIINTTYESCGYDPERLYAEAGTRDPWAASEWVGQLTTDRYRHLAVEACHAALTGQPRP